MDEAFLGQIELFPYDFAPLGWILCDGRQLQIAANSALYSLIGIRFGGNGTTTFNLPDLRNAAPLEGVAFYIATQGIYPSRN